MKKGESGNIEECKEQSFAITAITITITEPSEEETVAQMDCKTEQKRSLHPSSFAGQTPMAGSIGDTS